MVLKLGFFEMILINMKLFIVAALLCSSASALSVDLAEFHATYEKDIRPIFETKCFHCHHEAHNTWYKEKKFMRDFYEEQVELSMSSYIMQDDFKESKLDDLKDELEMIKAELENDTMPPWENVFIKPFNSLKKTEKKKVLDWVEQGLIRIQGKK